ncbi:MAG: hypothetical protein CTY21_12260 [Methylomonas sp.]|nr:MAG: hypothetical protein CTY21_12260 [Methylomonas sp.]
MRLGNIKASYEAEVKRLKDQANRQIDKAVDQATSVALQAALALAQKKVESEVLQILGPRVR